LVSIPSYILRSLYVKGSLKNRDEGFEFALKNNLYPGTLTSLVKVEVDGNTVEQDNVLVGKREAAMRKAVEISYQKPLQFRVGETLLVRVLGLTLATGEHKIVLTVDAAEGGRLNVPITSTL